MNSGIFEIRNEHLKYLKYSKRKRNTPSIPQVYPEYPLNSRNLKEPVLWANHPWKSGRPISVLRCSTRSQADRELKKQNKILSANLKQINITQENLTSTNIKMRPHKYFDPVVDQQSSTGPQKGIKLVISPCSRAIEEFSFYFMDTPFI